ncbi:MAG: TonB-dependent receptor [Phycisphaerales bacterium]|nr:MAG: TonB-dependent receptor [Phycisphaerales bacterium]
MTASRREQKITTVPYAIRVITSEDIRRSGARSVPDALRLAPGIDIADLSSGVYGISTRGDHAFLSNRLLVLVDGRQIYDSVFGGTLWGSWPFQVEDIDRIEVIHGPGGVTWGANAVHGVINIITKDPTDQLGLTVTAGGGSRGTFKKHLGYAFTKDKLRLRISGEYEASDGFSKGGSILRSLEDDYKTGRVSLHGIYESDAESTFTFSAGSAVVDGAYPPPPTAGIGRRRNSGTQASFLLSKWVHRESESSTYELTGYVNDFHASPGIPMMDFRYQQFAVQFGHIFKPNPQHRLAWGIDGRIELLDTTNSDPFLLSKDFVSTGNIGVYLQDEWCFAPKWTLNAGGRIDYEFYGGFQPSARAALSYEMDDGSTAYGAVSRAFQMHPAGLRFFDMPLLNGLAHTTRHRDPEAEVLFAYEFGYRKRLFERLDVNLNMF